ncbi:transposon Ty3-G Gag-Pol polyprotein [Pseudoscourfieldia marina]
MAKAAAAPGCCWGLAYLAVLWVLWYTGSDCKKSKRQRWRSLRRWRRERRRWCNLMDKQPCRASRGRGSAHVMLAAHAWAEDEGGITSEEEEGEAWLSRSVPWGEVEAEEAYEECQGWKLSSRLTPVQREELASLLTAHKEAFAFSNAEIVGYKGEQGPFEIPLSDDGSTREKARRLSKREQEIVDEYYTELRDLDFIERADKKDPRYGRYGTNTTVAAKKDAETGLWTDARICQDSRKPNEKCLRDLREMHRADELLRSAAKRQYFSTIDLRKGFHQIPVKEEHRIHTSFWWKGELWVWRVMSFGWRNASAKFQTVMDAELEKHGLTPDARTYTSAELLRDDALARRDEVQRASLTDEGVPRTPTHKILVETAEKQLESAQKLLTALVDTAESPDSDQTLVLDKESDVTAEEPTTTTTSSVSLTTID